MIKIPHLMFLIVAALSTVLAVFLLGVERSDGHGYPHPDEAFQGQVHRGGDGDRHSAKLIAAGGLYGALQIVFLSAGLCFGISRKRSKVMPLVVGGIAYLLVFGALVGTYAQGMEGAPIVLGLPLPSALMMYGMWIAPWSFVIMYVLKFKDWVYNDDDAKRFSELLDLAKAKRGRVK